MVLRAKLLQTSERTQYAKQNPPADHETCQSSARENPQLTGMCNMSPQATSHFSLQQKEDICGFTSALYKHSKSFFFFFFATWAHTPLRLLESILKPVAAIAGYLTDKKIETVTNKKFSLIVLYLFQKLRDSVKNV